MVFFSTYVFSSFFRASFISLLVMACFMVVLGVLRLYAKERVSEKTKKGEKCLLVLLRALRQSPHSLRNKDEGEANKRNKNENKKL